MRSEFRVLCGRGYGIGHSLGNRGGSYRLFQCSTGEEMATARRTFRTRAPLENQRLRHRTGCPYVMQSGKSCRCTRDGARSPAFAVENTTDVTTIPRPPLAPRVYLLASCACSSARATRARRQARASTHAGAAEAVTAPSPQIAAPARAPVAERSKSATASESQPLVCNARLRTITRAARRSGGVGANCSPNSRR